MKRKYLMAATAAAALIGTGAKAAELPGYELTGFPITQHQVAVMGAENVREQSPIPTLTFGGMPASPHQIAVLTPRRSRTAEVSAAKLTTLGSVSK